MPTVAGGTAPSEWIIGQPLNKGKQNAIPIGAGATIMGPIIELPGGPAELTVNYEMTGGASADLAVYCYPLKSDGTPMSLISLTPVRTAGPTAGGGVVQESNTFDVSGYTKVQIAAKNSNAGAQTINEVYYKVANQS